jgi:SAM-dependent methyltransferase
MIKRVGRRSVPSWRLMDGSIDPALQEHYALGKERDRLAEARGILEFERTKEIVLRHLPAPPSVIADIGGGPGRYALWLAERGHRVEHRDLMPLHVDQVRAVADVSRINAAVGDARDLDLDDGAVDAVLLLGPLYHLRRREERLQALRRPGGWSALVVRCSWPPSPAGRPGWTASCAPGCTNHCRRSAS